MQARHQIQAHISRNLDERRRQRGALPALATLTIMGNPCSDQVRPNPSPNP